MKVVKLPPLPQLLDAEQTDLIVSAIGETLDRIAAGETSCIVIAEIGRAGPLVAYAGLDADPLRMIGLLARVQREAMDLMDEEYE